MAITKEYNIRRHYEIKCQDKYKDLDINQNLKSGGDEKKLGFTKDNVQKSYIQSEAAKKASFIMATKIAKSAGLSMRESL